jgi:hypothetical protein
MEPNMLKDLHVDQARYIARIANTARAQRDALLGNVAEDDLDGPTPGRGERNPTAELGVDVLPADVSKPVAALREAINSLSVPARRELYALMRIGQGHLAVQQYDRASAPCITRTRPGN